MAGFVTFALKGIAAGEVRDNQVNGVEDRKQPLLANMSDICTPQFVIRRVNQFLAMFGAWCSTTMTSGPLQTRRGKSWRRTSFSASRRDRIASLANARTVEALQHPVFVPPVKSLNPSCLIWCGHISIRQLGYHERNSIAFPTEQTPWRRRHKLPRPRRQNASSRNLRNTLTIPMNASSIWAQYKTMTYSTGKQSLKVCQGRHIKVNQTSTAASLPRYERILKRMVTDTTLGKYRWPLAPQHHHTPLLPSSPTHNKILNPHCAPQHFLHNR